MSPTTLTAATGGPSLGNPGPASRAWYVDDDCWIAGGWENSTSNRGELTAILEPLQATEAAGFTGEKLSIQCNSQYVVNSLTKWHHNWKKRGWHKVDGKPILNPSPIRNLGAMLVSRTVRFEWMRRHVGHPMNEAADSRVCGAATAFQQGRPVPIGPGWTRGDQASKNREAQQAPSATPSNIPTAPQTDALF